MNLFVRRRQHNNYESLLTTFLLNEVQGFFRTQYSLEKGNLLENLIAVRVCYKPLHCK